MPGSSNAFSSLEATNSFAYSDNISDCFMARYAGEQIPQQALLHETVAVAYAAGEYLYQDIARAGFLEFYLVEGQLCALGLEEGGLVGFGKNRRRHA